MNIEWATGIFEGEGYIKTDKRLESSFNLKVKMSDLDIIQRFQNVFQVGSITVDTVPKKPHHRQLYSWTVCNRKDIAFVLSLMLPLLGNRRAHDAMTVLDNLELPR